MTNRGLAVLGVRLLALYFFIQQLGALPLVLLSVGGWSGLWLFTAYLLPVLLPVLLWLCAGQLASLILPQRTSLPESKPMNLAAWYNVAFTGAGLLVLLNALPEFMRLLLDIWLQRLEFQELASSQIAAVAGRLLQCLLGLFVLLGSRGLSRVVLRLRTAKLQHSLD